MSSNPGIYLGLMPWLLVLAVLAGAIIVVVILLERRRPVQPGPSCGKCGYVVTGLPTFTCPECGSDLREVGIIAAGTRRPLSPLAKIVIWTISLPLPALIISTLIAAFGPQADHHWSSYDFTPSSGAYTRITLQSDTKGPPSNYRQNLKFFLRLTPKPTTRPQGNVSDLTVDPASGYRYVRPDGQVISGASGFDAHVILDWMEAAGIDGANAAAQNETTELLAQAQWMRNGGTGIEPMPSFTSVGGSSTGSSGPALWLTITLLIFWPAVWLLGLWRFTRRKTRGSPALKC